MPSNTLSPRRVSGILTSVCRRTQGLQTPRACPRRRFHSSWEAKGAEETSHGLFGWHDCVVALAAGSTLFYGLGVFGPLHVYAEGPGEEKLSFEKRRRKGTSKEDNRDLLSSQHLQVKKSWENPGVYAWGSNSGRVVAPDSEDELIKGPRRIPFFDGILLRDMKLHRDFGAAIDERGDLLQWGAAYSKSNTQPTVTLRGKNLVSLAVSRDRVIGLAGNGRVYSIPVSQAEQASGPKLSESTWFPFWSTRSNISYRPMQPEKLSWGEKVCKISGGLEHVLLLTSKGRLFSAASASEAFPAVGQLGIPGLTWTTRPEGRYDQCHEISTLRGFDISKIATGDYHSLALDKEGRVFGFGSNGAGQLGLEYNSQAVNIDAPSLLPMQKLYNGTNYSPKVINMAAGGTNSFFMIDASRMTTTRDGPRGGQVAADTFSCGLGIWGGLGNGRWTHVQSTPTRIPSLSRLFEYDEQRNQVVPIRLTNISVGSTHVCAIMNNVTYVNAHEQSSENDTNWGADVLWWGGNEFFQLGTRRRSNVSTPTYIPPLDVEADRERGRREEHRFQITPRKEVKVGGRWVSVEQRVECGEMVSAVYSGV